MRLRFLRVRAEQGHERPDRARLGEGDLILEVISRERFECGGGVLLRDLVARAQQHDERRNAAWSGRVGFVRVRVRQGEGSSG